METRYHTKLRFQGLRPEAQPTFEGPNQYQDAVDFLRHETKGAWLMEQYHPNGQVNVTAYFNGEIDEAATAYLRGR